MLIVLVRLLCDILVCWVRICVVVLLVFSVLFIVCIICIWLSVGVVGLVSLFGGSLVIWGKKLLKVISEVSRLLVMCVFGMLVLYSDNVLL